MSMVSYGANLNEDVKFLEKIEPLGIDNPCEEFREMIYDMLREFLENDDVACQIAKIIEKNCNKTIK